MFSEKFSLKQTFAVSYNPLCIGNPGPPKLDSTRKVIQLTGDFDRERGSRTPNQTSSAFQVYGTDLGVSFLYDGKLYFLFGDTTRRGPDEGLPQTGLPGTHFNEKETDYDAIAYSTSDRAYEGISLKFNSSPPTVKNISQLTAEHPIEGITIGKDMYVYFTTDMYLDRRIYPTRSVLAKSNDGGYTFGNSFYTLSTDKFIHISAQIVDNDKIKGLPDQTGKGLLLWGTGKYRQSDIYLAYMPLDEITNKNSIKFFSGLDKDLGNPLWKSNESEATPLFSASCVGELSIRWNYYLEKWVMLYNCNLCNTNGVVVRFSNKPWGHWSSSKIIFDNDNGYKRFIHKPGFDQLHDKDRDHLTNPFDVGYVYGPYQITPYSTGVKGRYTKIYFTLSTWNPYQVIQMSTILLSEEEENCNLPYASCSSDRNDRKYAYISVLLAHLANSKGVEFDKQVGNSTYIADHIEWAQFHTHLELRYELKNRIYQIMKNLANDIDIADAYSAIVCAIVRLAYDYCSFNNVANDLKHKKWALDLIHAGNRSMLIDEVNQYIDYFGFLPDHDDICYAYDADDPNEFKYARLSILEANLAIKDGKVKPDVRNEKSNGSLSFMTWARFRTTRELQENLFSKINKTIFGYNSETGIAKAYAQVVKVIVALSSKTDDKDSHLDYYQWALTLARNKEFDEISRELLKYIYDENFLFSFPTNSIV